MRQLLYRLLEHDEEEKSGSLAAFLEDIPHLATYCYFPPLRVLNSLLRQGKAGGSSHRLSWQPFEIAPTEYVEVAAELLPRRGWKESPPSLDAADYEEWKAKLAEQETGLPAQEYLGIARRVAALGEARERAHAQGDLARAAELEASWQREAGRLTDLVNRYLVRPTR